MEHINPERSERFLTYHHLRTSAPDGSAFERHCHDCFELLFVREGRGKAVVEGAEYPLLAGSVYLFRPFEYHYVCPEEGAPYERYVVNFGAEIPVGAAAALPFLTKEGGFDGNGIYFCDESQTIEQIFSLLDLPDPSESLLKNAMLRTVVTQTLILLSHSPVSCNGTEDTLASNIIEYLNENLDKELSLEEIAKHFFISKYYLCRVFRKNTGVSVIRFVNAKRVAKAKLLIAGGTPATEAALEAGFHDYSVFYRACKKSTGHAPVAERSAEK